MSPQVIAVRVAACARIVSREMSLADEARCHGNVWEEIKHIRAANQINRRRIRLAATRG